MNIKELLRQKCAKYKYALCFFLMLLCFFRYTVQQLYGFSIYPDEYSYWAYAAGSAGYDWSGITGLGSFYAWGYSLILLPVFVLCPDPLTAYRIAVMLNFVMIGASYVLLCRVLRKCGFLNRESNQIYAAIAMFYPPLIFYAQMTMAETVLAAGYLVLAALMAEYLEKPRPAAAAGIFAVCSYLYLAHMRTIGIFAAAVGLVIYVEIRYSRDRKRAAAAAAAFLAIMVVIHIGREQVSAAFYPNADTELYEINSLAGQIKKVRYILSLDGFYDFFFSVCGKLLYLGISSYGLAYMGIFHMLKVCGRSWKRKCGLSAESILCAFFLLSTLSQVMISAVYNVMPDSYDCIIYGRYQDYVTPVLIAAGLSEMVRGIKKTVRNLAAAGMVMILLTAVTYSYCADIALAPVKGYFAAGMSVFTSGDFQEGAFLVLSCAGAILCMIVFAALCSLYGRIGFPGIAVIGLTLQVLSAVRLGHQYIYPFNALARQDIQIAGQIENLVQEPEHEEYAVYVDYNEISAIGLLQFMLRNIEIRVCPDQEQALQDRLSERSVVILGADDPMQAALEKKYKEEIISGHFVLLYN